MRHYTILVHSSRAFSLRKKAEEITLYTGGILLDEETSRLYNIVDMPTIAFAVITMVNSDLGDFAKIAFQAEETIIYGIIEGIPLLHPVAKQLVDNSLVFAPSNYSRRKLEEAGITVADTVYFYVGEEEFNVENARIIRHSLMKRGNYERIILWVGANQYRKGIDLVCSIAEYLPNYLFLIHSGHGEIPPEHVLRGGKNCILHNKVFKYSIGDLYYASDLLLSTSRAEGFGLPPIEYLYFNKPVVVPEHPVYRELLGDYAYYYPVKSMRYQRFYNLMLMELYEPDISTAPDIIEKALARGKPAREEGVKKYLTNRFSLDNYFRFKRFLIRNKLV